MLDKKIYTRTYKSGWDTITEDVSINDIIQQHNWILGLYASQVNVYDKNWSKEFCVEQIKEATQKIPSQINEDIDFSVLSRKELYSIGFSNWDGRLVTIPLFLWDFIADGTEITCIDGEIAIKGKGSIDLDTRGGCIPYGFIKD